MEKKEEVIEVLGDLKTGEEKKVRVGEGEGERGEGGTGVLERCGI